MRNKVVAGLLAALGLLLGQPVFGVTQLVVNGNFNAIPPSADWGISPQSSTSTGILFENGFLSMGNTTGTNTQFVFQTVTIPTNTILPQYSFELGGTSSDAGGSSAFQAFIMDSTGTIILTNLGLAFNGSFGYGQNTYNLTNFAGLTVQLMYEVQLGAGVTNTAFDITDVSLLAFSSNDIPANDYFTNASDLSEVVGISVEATNILATKEPGEPRIADNNGGHSLWWKWKAPANGILTLTTKGSTFNTLLGVFTGDSVSNLTRVAADANGSNSVVKTPVALGTTYEIAVDGKNGGTGVAQLNLSFVLDTTPPKVTISSPASGAKVTNSTVTVKGTASDNVAVAFVQYRLENAEGTNDYQDADGTNTWTAMVNNLIPGLNTIRVRAYDTSSNVSATVARSVTYIVVSRLTLTINGSGIVSPNLNGQLLDVGNNYTFMAKAGTGEVLSNWVDGNGVVLATTPALTVTMQSNLVLQANFVPNPFIPNVGVYQGLFYDTNGPQHQSSGFYNLTLANSGSFSAKVIIAGKSYSYSGQFSAGGSASNNIVRKGLSPVSAQLQLDLQGGGITGLLSSADPWTAELNADRAMTNAAAEAGHYTLMIPGADNDTNSAAQPGGDSYGTALVSATGGIAFAGVLADDTKVSQKALLLANGQWPFYIPLYSGKGSILGWLTFSNQTNSDITGTVDWFKPAQAAKFYPAGFTNSTEATGSSYHFTTGVPVLNFTNGVVWFANGNPPADFTNQVVLGANNVVTNASTNTLTLKLTTSTGLFSVSAVNPDTGKIVTGKGVVLQKQNFGDGFFLGTNQVGQLFWGPASP